MSFFDSLAKVSLTSIVAKYESISEILDDIIVEVVDDETFTFLPSKSTNPIEVLPIPVPGKNVCCRILIFVVEFYFSPAHNKIQLKTRCIGLVVEFYFLL